MPSTVTVSRWALSISDAPAAGPARDADDARPPGPRLVDGHLEAVLGEPAGDVRGDLGLACAAGDERGVDRVDRHQLGEQRVGRHGAKFVAARTAGRASTDCLCHYSL